MEKLYKAMDEVISCIKESDEYKNCLSLKIRMSANQEIIMLVREVKKLQKDYIRSNDCLVKEKLDEVLDRLKEIPIYKIYLNNLEKVNEKIEYVKDSLNDYFYKLLNEKAL